MSCPQPSKLNNNLVQQFLLPDETPPILEAEMSLRAEQLINSTKLIVAPDRRSRSQEARSQEGTPLPQRQQEDMRSETSGEKPQAKQVEKRMEKVKQVEETEERQEPEGRQADTTVTEQDRKEVPL